MQSEESQKKLHWHISHFPKGDLATNAEGQLLYLITDDGVLYEATYCEPIAGKPAVLMVHVWDCDDREKGYAGSIRERAMREAEIRHRCRKGVDVTL